MQPLSFVSAVLSRPQMYTPSGTYGEVVSFLTGYYSGIANGDIYDAELHIWNDFRNWLQEKMGSDTASAFQMLLTDEQPLQRLSQLFAMWQREAQNALVKQAEFAMKI